MTVLPIEAREASMCEKCREIDAKVEHYRQLAERLTDRQTLDGIRRIIDELELEKAALHPS
jgi:hypothetical protein